MNDLFHASWFAVVAEWIWGASPNADISAEICSSQFPLMHGGCWPQLISKLLGIVIILGSCLNQIPIMINLYNSKSASGFSKTFLYGDLLIKSNAALYGYLADIPLTAYGENIALSIQSFAVLLLVWHFAKIPTDERVTATVGGITYGFVVIKLLPDRYRYLLMASIWPLLLYSRGAQILETQKVKHTGAHSIITTGSNLVGGLVRIGTILVDVGVDIPMLTGLVLSVSLNTIATIQYFAYKSNTDKLYNDLQAKKAT